MKKTNENGITLIALVVTIVVLLILAGITITYVMSGDGVFKNAQDAATKTIEGQIQDYAGQLQAAVMMDDAVAAGTGAERHYGATIESTEAQKFFPSDLYTIADVDPAKKLTVETGKIKSGTIEVTAKKQR